MLLYNISTFGVDMTFSATVAPDEAIEECDEVNTGESDPVMCPWGGRPVDLERASPPRPSLTPEPDGRVAVRSAAPAATAGSISGSTRAPRARRCVPARP